MVSASSPRKTWGSITSIPGRALDSGTFKVLFYNWSNRDERAKYRPSCSLLYLPTSVQVNL
jgi:hypothetical protein